MTLTIELNDFVMNIYGYEPSIYTIQYASFGETNNQAPCAQHQSRACVPHGPDNESSTMCATPTIEATTGR